MLRTIEASGRVAFVAGINGDALALFDAVKALALRSGDTLVLIGDFLSRSCGGPLARLPMPLREPSEEGRRRAEHRTVEWVHALWEVGPVVGLQVAVVLGLNDMVWLREYIQGAFEYEEELELRPSWMVEMDTVLEVRRPGLTPVLALYGGFKPKKSWRDQCGEDQQLRRVPSLREGPREVFWAERWDDREHDVVFGSPTPCEPNALVYVTTNRHARRCYGINTNSWTGGVVTAMVLPTGSDTPSFLGVQTQAFVPGSGWTSGQPGYPLRTWEEARAERRVLVVPSVRSKEAVEP